MRSLHSLLVFFLPTAVLLGGCAPVDDDVPLGESLDVPFEPTAGGMTYEPPTGRNGLVPLEYWSPVSQTALRQSQYNSLGSTVIYTAPNGTTHPTLLITPSMENLLETYPSVVKHLVQCALGPGQSTYDPINDVVYHGWWGLAKPWLNAPLSDADKQSWVTGCMIARLNNLGVHVGILLEGAHPPIEYNPIYDNPTGFWYNESTVFGNMFSSTTLITPNAPAFSAYLCREQNLVVTCPDGGLDWIDRRLCDNAPATCGIVDVGKCSRPVALGGNCTSNGPEHWKCRPSSLAGYDSFTVGVQLEVPLDPGECISNF